MEQELKEAILDMRDRVVRIETKLERLPEIETKVERHSKEILKAKTSVSVVRWLLGVVFLAVPAAVATAVRIFRD